MYDKKQSMIFNKISFICLKSRLHLQDEQNRKPSLCEVLKITDTVNVLKSLNLISH